MGNVPGYQPRKRKEDPGEQPTASTTEVLMHSGYYNVSLSMCSLPIDLTIVMKLDLIK